MPCLNEAETLERCIRKARDYIERSKLPAEILIADNGSTDGSQALAAMLGARVIDVPARGYGAALYAGSVAAEGEWIVMGDSDDSYDFSNLDSFICALKSGWEVVIGNRFRGGIGHGAMPWKNRYIGNPILTRVGQILFRCPVGDFHCGLRAYSKSAFTRMELRTTGMEFASEMVIKATLLGMRITEVPTTLSKDGRSRPPHLRPWRDGWRHLRFMLLFSPRWLFLIPGLILACVSTIGYVALLTGPVTIWRFTFDIHTLFLLQTSMVLGLLAVAFGISARMFGMREGFLPEQPFLKSLQNLPLLEIGSVVGASMIAIGVYFGTRAFSIWGEADFGQLNLGPLLRGISMAGTFSLVGGITLMTSLIIGFLALPTRR